MRRLALLLILLALIVVNGRIASEKKTLVPISDFQENPAFEDNRYGLSDMTPENVKEKKEKTTSQEQESTIASRPANMLENSRVEPFIPVATKPSLPLSEVNTMARGALVNIICSTRAGGYFNSASGSGILLNNSGLILTNAHIAQYLLIGKNYADLFLSCHTRLGSPAKGNFGLELVFIPRAWVINNAKKINETKVLESGENDFALLKLRDGLPANINFNPLVLFDENVFYEDSADVLVAGYPGSGLGGILVQTDLNIVSSFGKISKIFTFSSQNNADLLEISGSVLAQGGVSGGAVVDLSGQLAGMVATASENSEKINERKVGAITMFHVKSVLSSETGFDLKDVIFGKWPELKAFFEKSETELFNLLKQKVSLEG